MIYLSASTKQFFDNPSLFGCMFSYRPIGGQDDALEAGCKWMLDNGAFTGRFVFTEWANTLLDLREYQENCLGVVVPDEPYNANETLRKFHLYRVFPWCLNYKVALATQDGLTPDRVPWNLLDALFIGGSDAHKRGIEATKLAMAAKQHGKWIHVGRVSGGQPIRQFWSWADSFDGTTFVRNGKNWNADDKMRTISAALEHIRDFDQWGML